MPKFSLQVTEDVIARVEVVKERLVSDTGNDYSTEGMLRDLVVIGLDTIAKNGGSLPTLFTAPKNRRRSGE